MHLPTAPLRMWKNRCKSANYPAPGHPPTIYNMGDEKERSNSQSLPFLHKTSTSCYLKWLFLLATLLSNLVALAPLEMWESTMTLFWTLLLQVIHPPYENGDKKDRSNSRMHAQVFLQDLQEAIYIHSLLLPYYNPPFPSFLLSFPPFAYHAFLTMLVFQPMYLPIAPFGMWDYHQL